MKKNLLILIIFILSTSVWAKELSLYGTRPFVSLTYGVKPRWDYNLFYAETVNASNKEYEGERIVARDVQSYFQTGLTFKYSPNLNFTGGYVFQRNNPLYKDFVNENRLWQQIVVAHGVSYFTLSHRFRFEERFIDNRETKHTNPMATRLRYQISFTAPLQGKEIDPGEFFFNTYNEFYFSTTGERNALFSENWTYAGFGYQTNKFGKLEFGPLVQWAKTNRDGDTRMFYLMQLGWSYTF